MKQRAAIYLRISETDEKVDKVDLQEKRLIKILEKESYLLVDTYPDDGISGYSGKQRNGWNALRSDIALDKIDVVLVDRQDRLMRNSMETEVFKVLCKQHKVIWQFSDGSKSDPANTMDAAMASFKGIMDQMESDIKKDRLRNRFDAEVADGMPLWGTRPFGYRADPDAPVDKNGKRSQRWTLLAHDVCPQKAENHDACTDHVDEAEELRLAYMVILNPSVDGLKENGTIYSIIRDWNERGVRTSTGKAWSYATVQQMLRRPRNAGIVMRNDVEQIGVKASWEPIIDRETWQAVQDILSDKKRRTAPGRKQSHLSAGLVTCGVCGGVMRSASVKLKGIVTPIYKCAKKMNVQGLGERHTTIQTNLLDPIIRDAVISAFVFGPEDSLPTDSDTSSAPLEAALSGIRASRARLIKLVTADLVDESDVAAELNDLKEKERLLVDQLAELARSNAHKTMTVDLRKGLWTGKRTTFAQVAKAKIALAERFDSLNLSQQRELVKQHLQVTVNGGRGIDRVKIRYLRAVSLNEDEWPEVG